MSCQIDRATKLGIHGNNTGIVQYQIHNGFKILHCQPVRFRLVDHFRANRQHVANIIQPLSEKTSSKTVSHQFVIALTGLYTNDFETKFCCFNHL